MLKSSIAALAWISRPICNALTTLRELWLIPLPSWTFNVGVGIRETLTRPVLFNEVIGDPTTQYTSIQSYLEKAKENGKEHLVRSISVDSAGHCNFSTASYVAVVEALDERYEWASGPSLTAFDMNARARAVVPTAPNVFVEYEFEGFARPFFLDDVYHITGCADFAAANAAPGHADRDPRFLQSGFAPGATGAKKHLCTK